MSAAMPMADNGDEEEWEAIMATMRQHTKTPNATAPWIKSLFDHRMDQIQDAKNTLSTQTDQYLSKRARGSIMVSAGSQPARRSRSQSVSINPVPPSVEIFDQSMPIASSFSRRGLSQPTMSPSYASGRHVRERHMSVATTVSDMSESEDVLRERMGGFTDASAKFAVASVTSPASQTSTAKSPSFKPTLQDTLRNVSKNIAKRLFKRAGDASSSSAPSTPAIGLPTMPAPAAGAGAGVGMSPLHEEDENTSGGTMSSHTYSSAYSTSEYDDDHEEREEAQVQRVQERAPVKITGLPPLPKPPVAQPMPSINMSNASKSLPAPPRGPPPAPPSVNATQQQQILPDDVSFSISDISGLSDPSNSDRPSQRSRSASISISDPSESDQMSAGRAPSDSTDSSLLDGLNAEFANQAASQQVQLPTGGGGGGIRAGLGSMPDSSQMGLAARSDSDSDDMFDLLDDMEVSSETRTASRASMLSQVPGGGLGGLGELGGGHGGSLPSVAASVGTRGSVSGGGTDAVVMDDVDDFDD
ncbi:hypothetical protein BC831DRAFT_82691 [Entophlyctis helioformis]|nr:hypothetical protein BC831DRAFT_82691 [Entophlyctis helioformis]